MLATVASCSFALSGPDPNRPAAQAPECDTGKGLVGLDGLMGATMGFASLGLLASNEGAGAAVTGLIGVAFIASAVRGNSAVNECRAALAEFHTRPYEPGPEEPQVAETLPPPKPKAKPQPQPPTVMMPPADPYADAPPTVGPAVTPPLTKPTPAPTKPVPPPTKPAPTPPPAADDDWNDFWTEVP